MSQSPDLRIDRNRPDIGQGTTVLVAVNFALIIAATYAAQAAGRFRGKSGMGWGCHIGNAMGIYAARPAPLGAS